MANPTQINLKSVSLNGMLRSGNIPIPPTSNTDYLFAPIYLPSMPPYSMRAFYPDLTSKHVVQNFNNAYPGLEWIQPFWVYGAHGYVLWEIVQGPPGMTIGNTLIRDPISGFFYPDADYANLKWPNPTAGRQKIGIRATDQAGQMAYWIFDLFVDPNKHFFMSLNGSGTGLGTSPSNYASFANTVKGATTVSPAKDKVLHIKGDTFAASATEIFADTAFISASWVAMPGEKPVFQQKINNTSANISLYGLKFAGIPTGGFGVIGNGYTEYSNFGVWRCEFDACYRTGTENSNTACIGFSKIDNGTGRQVVFMSENTFKNNTTLHGTDFYNVRDYVFIRSNLQITDGTTVLPQSWVFPKVQAQGEIMYNYADIPGVTTTNDSIIQMLNAWEPNFPRSYDMNCRCEYNFVRTGGASILRSNADEDNVLPQLPVNTLSNYVKRNTFIGGSVTAEFYYSATARTKRHTYFESNVIINNTGGLTVPPSSSAWFFVTGTNVNGTPAAGLVDSNGHLVNTANWGKTGRDIWRPA
jgi:hypothetical protein